jgi:hypothetical protein
VIKLHLDPSLLGPGSGRELGLGGGGLYRRLGRALGFAMLVGTVLTSWLSLYSTSCEVILSTQVPSSWSKHPACTHCPVTDIRTTPLFVPVPQPRHVDGKSSKRRLTTSLVLILWLTWPFML